MIAKYADHLTPTCPRNSWFLEFQSVIEYDSVIQPIPFSSLSFIWYWMVLVLLFFGITAYLLYQIQ